MDIFGSFLFHEATFSWGIRSFASISLVAISIALMASMPIRKVARGAEGYLPVLGALFVMGLFGGVVGFHGGNSRVGVVGDVIPAVITLVAGIAAYLFGVGDKKPGPLLFPMLGSFVATLFVSYSMGAANHQPNQDNALFDQQCHAVFSNADILASDAAFERAQTIFASCEKFWEIDGVPDGDPQAMPVD